MDSFFKEGVCDEEGVVHPFIACWDHGIAVVPTSRLLPFEKGEAGGVGWPTNSYCPRFLEEAAILHEPFVCSSDAPVRITRRGHFYTRGAFVFHTGS